MILRTPLKNLSHNITQTLTQEDKEPAHLPGAILNRDTAVSEPEAPQQPPAPLSGWLSGVTGVHRSSLNRAGSLR